MASRRVEKGAPRWTVALPGGPEEIVRPVGPAVSGASRRPGRVRVVVLAAVVGALLAACSGDPGAAPAAAPPPTQTQTQTQKPTPTPTPTPSAEPVSASPVTDPAQIAEKVALWYSTGGEEHLTQAIRVTAEIRAARDRRALMIDFTSFFPAVRTARAYGPVPDRTTQTAWSTALTHLSEGAGRVLAVSELGTVQSESPRRTARLARGWREFDDGVKGLKAVEARLDRVFGRKLPGDPWEVLP